MTLDESFLLDDEQMSAKVEEFSRPLRAMSRPRLHDQCEIAERRLEEARDDVLEAGRREQLAEARWLAVHGRLYPLGDREWQELAKHPIPETGS